jgi:prolipoprotein diacylglyceryltransferase
MNVLMIISTQHGGLYYSIFYMAAFLIAGGIFMFNGIRNDYPARKWLILTLFGVMCFIIGNKLITVSPQEIADSFIKRSWPDSGRSILGGILGMILGLLFAKKWLKINYPVLDNLAYALPLSMIVTRFGCLFAGCCSGIPTDLPWGIQYVTGSIPLTSHTNISQALHPTQIYDMILCLVIVIMLKISWKRWRVPGSRFLFVVLCYTFFRFFEEFFRKSYPVYPTNESIAGLKLIQWLLIGSFLILVSILIYRERKIKIKKEISQTAAPATLLREFLIFALIPLFLLLTDGWLDIFEKIMLWVFFLPPMAMYIYHFYCHLTIPALRWSVPFIIILTFITMSQTLVPDENKEVTYWETGVGTMFGNYSKYVMMLDGVRNCSSTTSDSHLRKYTFNTTGFELSKYRLKNEYHSFGLGGRFYLGLQGMKRVSNGDSDGIDFIFGVNPFMSFKSKFFGIDAGCHIGYFKYAIISKSIKSSNTGEYVDAPADLVIFPQLMLRFGKIDIIYFEGKIASHFPSSSPMPLLEAGFASGLGNLDGRKIGLGFTDVGNPDYEGYDNGKDLKGYYVTAIIPVKNRYLIEASFADNFRHGYANGWVFSAGLHHRFDYKTEPRTP